MVYEQFLNVRNTEVSYTKLPLTNFVSKAKNALLELVYAHLHYRLSSLNSHLLLFILFRYR